MLNDAAGNADDLNKDPGVCSGIGSLGAGSTGNGANGNGQLALQHPSSSDTPLASTISAPAAVSSNLDPASLADGGCEGCHGQRSGQNEVDIRPPSTTNDISMKHHTSTPNGHGHSDNRWMASNTNNNNHNNSTTHDFDELCKTLLAAQFNEMMATVRAEVAAQLAEVTNQITSMQKSVAGSIHNSAGNIKAMVLTQVEELRSDLADFKNQALIQGEWFAMNKDDDNNINTSLVGTWSALSPPRGPAQVPTTTPSAPSDGIGMSSRGSGHGEHHQRGKSCGGTGPSALDPRRARTKDGKKYCFFHVAGACKIAGCRFSHAAPPKAVRKSILEYMQTGSPHRMAVAVVDPGLVSLHRGAVDIDAVPPFSGPTTTTTTTTRPPTTTRAMPTVSRRTVPAGQWAPTLQPTGPTPTMISTRLPSQPQPGVRMQQGHWFTAGSKRPSLRTSCGGTGSTALPSGGVATATSAGGNRSLRERRQQSSSVAVHNRWSALVADGDSNPEDAGAVA